MKRAILFDLDGVLVSSYESWYRLLNAAARDLGYTHISRTAFDATWGQGLAADVQSFYPRHTFAQIQRYYDSHFRFYTNDMAVHPDAATLLARLHERGVRTAVVTNTPTELAREILAAAQLRPDTVVGSTDVRRAKPEPDMLWLACDRLEVDCNDCVMVGDSHFDRDAARAADVHFAGFGIDGDTTLDELHEIFALATDSPWVPNVR